MGDGRFCASHVVARLLGGFGRELSDSVVLKTELWRMWPTIGNSGVAQSRGDEATRRHGDKLVAPFFGLGCNKFQREIVRARPPPFMFLSFIF